jgi:hypothetical protein
MLQESNKSSNGVGSSISVKDRQDDAAKDSKDWEKQAKVDVKKEKNLELCKGADNMPELKNEPKLLEDEQITLDLNEPPPEVMEYAKREIGETDEVKCLMLQELRDLIYGNSKSEYRINNYYKREIYAKCYKFDYVTDKSF